MKNEKIVIVDDSLFDLTACNEILKPHYTVHPVASVVKMFSILEQITPDIIIMDYSMPSIDGLDAVRMLRSNEKFTNIPIILITGDERAEIEAKALHIGVIDYIKKPVDPSTLLSHVQSRIAMSKQSQELRSLNMEVYKKLRLHSEQIETLQNAIFSIIGELVEFRDITTGRHIMNTQRYMICLLQKMIEINHHYYIEEIGRWDYQTAILSTQLHDIGKIGIHDTLLNKVEKLTEEEYEEIKRHVEIGVKIIDSMIKITCNSKFLLQAKLFIQYHHEKWDGSGYPYGRSGTGIPLEGRLLSIIDVYDALTSERPYKKPLIHKAAVRIIEEGSGTQFDPEVVAVFLLVAEEFESILNDRELIIRSFNEGGNICIPNDDE